MVEDLGGFAARSELREDAKELDAEDVIEDWGSRLGRGAP